MSIRKAIYLATFISTLGDGMFYIATSWYVYQKMQTSLAVGVLLAFTLAPVIVVFPFTGYVADKYNRKKTAIIMDIVRFILIFFGGIFFFHERNNITVFQIYILTGMVKIGDCFFSPCITSLIKINFDSCDYMKIFSVNNTLQQLGTILGSAITGLLLSRYDITYILFFDAFSFALSAIVISMMKKDTVVTFSESNKNVLINLKEGLKYTLKKNGALLLVVLCGVPSFIVNMINTLLCEHTEKTLGLSVREYSIFDASFGVGCAIMGALMTIILNKVKENKLGLIGYFLLPIVLFIMSITCDFYITMIAIVVLGAVIMIISVNSKALFAKIIDKEFIGRVDSYSYTVNSLITSIAGIVVGYLSSISNTVIAFRCYSAISMLFIIVQCYIMKSQNGDKVYE